jgi:4-amino-4-deoxy-L-arabinose transferase-like glycosyltransferase
MGTLPLGGFGSGAESAMVPGPIYFRSILALALVPRIGVAWLVLSTHPPAWFFNNAADLGYLAQSVVSGHGLSSPFGGTTGASALITPGYPLLIALIFRILGSYSLASAVAVISLQTLCAVLTVVVMMHMANRLFGAQTANLAGVFWAVSPPLLWLPILFWETCLSTLLMTGAMALALLIVKRPGRKLWLLAGAYCGLALLVNPALILAMIAMLAWAAVQTRSASRYDSLAGLILMLAIFAPWPIRNVRIMHAPIPLRSSFGYELWQGNREGGDGKFDDSLYPLHSQSQYAEYASRGELAYMRSKSALAIAYVRAHPGVFLRLTARRVARFWIGTGGKGDLLEVELHAVATMVLGLWGLILLFRRNISTAKLFLVPLLLFPLPYYITDIKFRYRFVIDPLMTILAAYAITQWIALRRGSNRRIAAPSS